MGCMKLNHLITFLLPVAFLLLPTLTPNPMHFTVQGRQLFKLTDVAAMRKNEEKLVHMRPVIGSKPPRCDERCKSCGHCEAVQVPIEPTKKFSIQHSLINKKYFRGEGISGISNYKPMCWKCKCGDFMLNPW